MKRFGRYCLSGAFAVLAALGVLLVSNGAVQPVRASTHPSKAEGALLFHERGCEHCHGVDGVGAERGPDLSTIGKRWKAGRIAQQIRNGGDAMPAFGSVLQPDEVKSLVEYLKAKKKATKVAAAAAGGKTGQ